MQTPAPEPTSTAAAAPTATQVITALPPAPGEMPRRPLGKTGRELSVVGFGGIVVKDVSDQEAAAFVRQAIEAGINYFDVAPMYGDAEDRLGPALEPFRKDMFLACKTEQRWRSGAEKELARSLEKARTDYFDLYQFHAVSKISEVETIFGPDGALEAVLAARDAGKIKHIGFSAHDEASALAMIERFPFDSVLYPVNWITWHAGNFGPQVVQKAEEQGMGILALKTLARQPWTSGSRRDRWPKCWYEPVETAEDALLGMRFALSKKVTAAVSPGHAELLWLMCSLVNQVTPLTDDEEAQLIERSKEYLPLFNA